MSDVTFEIKSYDVTFNVACDLSQPMSKIEFSCTAKQLSKLWIIVRNSTKFMQWLDRRDSITFSSGNTMNKETHRPNAWLRLH